jgi:hypothetical protein
MRIYRNGAPLKTTERSKIMMMKEFWKQINKDPHEKLPQENIIFLLNSLASGKELDLTHNPSVSQLAKHLLFGMPHRLRSEAAANIKPHVNDQVWLSRFENENLRRPEEGVMQIPQPDFGIS